jgi:hypothetical protein
MPENQTDLKKAKIEIQPTDPKLWEQVDQDSLVGLFKLLLKIDIKKNPNIYKLNSNQPNSKSYEPPANKHIRHTNNTNKH